MIDSPLGSKLYPKKSKPLAIRPIKVLSGCFSTSKSLEDGVIYAIAEIASCICEAKT